jgi:ferritin-like metal-binding protein YciE
MRQFSVPSCPELGQGKTWRFIGCLEGGTGPGHTSLNRREAQAVWPWLKSAELKKAFLTHRDQTEQHVERLQEVFELIGRRAQAKTCEAIKGILEEGEEIMEEYSGSEALDAGLLAATQAGEHYEMSRHGTLKTWAGQLGLKVAVSLLDETLQEEKETDALLSSLAESSVNQEAA